MLWSEDAEGKLSHHFYQLHGGRFGTWAWSAAPSLHSDRTMRFFASPRFEQPERTSEYVDVRLPDVPPPTEVAARDAILGVIVTGKGHPHLQVRCSLGENSTTVSNKSGEWQALVSAPAGHHQVRVVVVHPVLGESTEVISEVVVTSPPKIPLQIQFPEVNRKISRVTGATGSATPDSDIRVSLGGGTATAKANAGGAWFLEGLNSNQSGPLKLQVENLSTGEVIERDVEVEYFPQWEVAELVLSPLVDGNGLVTKLGAIARGTGEPGYTITLSRESNPNAPGLLDIPVGEDSTWDFRHLSSPPAPPFPGGQLHVRSTGDPVVRPYRVGVQAPLILVPEEGQATGPQPVLSGFASRAFQLVLPDQSTMMVPVAADQSWQVQLPPLPLGIQVITAGDPREARETTRRTILVLEDVPEQD